MAANNPYVGPRPFTEQDEQFFFGRTEEIEVLASLVSTRRASLLFAQSGAGKSSLLMAGLAPRLLRHRRMVRHREVIDPLFSGLRIARVGKGLPELQPDNVFVYSVAASLSEALSPETAATVSADITLERIVSGLLPSVASDDGDAELLPFLLVFDQFEELFTRHLARRDDRVSFFQQVSAALARHDTLRVLFSMREDYIAELTPYAHLLPEQLRHRFRLERLGMTAALEAVRTPAALARPSHPFAEGVAEELCRNLQAGTGGDLEAILLQVVCKRLWNNLPDDRGEIGSSDLQTSGNVDAALRAYYDDVVSDVVRQLANTSTPVSERRVRRFFTQQLLTPGQTRALVFRDDRSGLTGGLPNAAIDVLSSPTVNIVRSEMRGGGRWYELSHDRLITPVVESNDEWEKTNMTPFQARALEWSRTRLDRDLLTPLELHEAQMQFSGPAADPLTPLEDEFLRRSELMRATSSATTRGSVGEVGWAVIFADDDPMRDAIRNALAPLLAHREAQTRRRFSRFEFEVTSQETAQSFLARYGAITQPSASAEPMPYYFLIVGSPERIPFEFQYGLDVHYAVGRVHFDGASVEDTLLMYARYARSVVAAESGAWALKRDAVVFAPLSEGDHAAKVLHRELVTPLYEDMERIGTDAGGWTVTRVVKEVATRDRLLRLLGGSHTPALLIAAGHGLGGRTTGETDQLETQGALVCSEFKLREKVEPSMYVAARDIDDSATLLGMIVFMAVTYGAGTPQYTVAVDGKRQQVAPRPFVSKLAQRLLSHPNGGALAVIGNVDTFWSYIFDKHEPGQDKERWRSEGSTTWFNAVSRLLRGYTAGSATEPFNTRYMQAASDLVESILNGSSVTDRGTQRLMLEAISVRNYVVLGDPAVRLPVEGPIVEQRPTIRVDASALTEQSEPEQVEAVPIYDMRLKRAIVAPSPATFRKRSAQIRAMRGADGVADRGSMAVFNGVTMSGEYAYALMPLDEFAALALGRSPESSLREDDSYRSEGASYFERPSSES
jgi:hypothetical protein